MKTITDALQKADKSLVCPNCGMELKLEIKQMTNSDLLNALKTNDR